MDEEKRPAGRPQIYQGWQPEQAGRRRPQPAQRLQEEKRKGEYRPLAVTEQNVSEHQSQKEAKIQKQKVIHVADIQQRPSQAVEHKPVQQRPSQTVERRPISQRPSQAVERRPMPQRPPQEIEHKPVPQRPPQEIERKPMPQRLPQTVERKPMPQRPPQAIERELVPQVTEPQAVKQKKAQRQVRTADQKKMTAAKRRRELENEIKMRSLWWVFGILCVILMIAIIYEVILGHGIKETGAERMEEQKQELVLDTEQNNIEILTPGGELVSEIKEREKRRSIQRQPETDGALANDSIQ